MKRIQLRESELVNLIRKVINEDVSCKCAQLNIVRHLNAEGNVWKETHEVVFVDCPCGSKGAFSPIDSGPKGELGELPKKIVRIKADGTEERRINEQEETITHEELMDGIDKYCPEVLEKEKMVGNRSCSRCHTPIMGIIKRWCESNKN